MKHAEPFLNWLNEAEEETSDDDEEVEVTDSDVFDSYFSNKENSFAEESSGMYTYRCAS